MQRVIGTAAWCCSQLAVACLLLGVVAAPVGADEPPVFVPAICILTACPNNIAPCFTVHAGDLTSLSHFSARIFHVAGVIFSFK